MCIVQWKWDEQQMPAGDGAVPVADGHGDLPGAAAHW